MPSTLKPLTDFLLSRGLEEVAHTGKTYMGHLINLYRLLESVGCSEEVCRAGMFHSIYGTQRFQGFKLPLEDRSAVRDLIGERAEFLAYVNCAAERGSLDRALEQTSEPYRILDRITGAEVVMSQADFDDLCKIHLYDWLEQVPRSKDWNYRRAGYRRMAERLGATALENYQSVFNQEGVTEQAPLRS